MNVSLQTQNSGITTAAVVGAGIAGLSCAKALQEAGLTVTVFEKSRGLGGRMSTRRAGDFQCDHGAQYFTARDPIFVAELDRWLRAGVAQAWLPVINRGGRKTSANTSDEVTRRFVGIPRMNTPLHWMAETLDIRNSTQVTNIRRGEHSWQIQADHNDSTMTRDFDAVVLAIPAPQASVLLPEQCSSLLQVCTRHTMFACWAVMLKFGQRLAIDFDAMFINNGPLRWVARDSSKPGRPEAEVWLLHASREWTAQHLEQAPEQVVNALKQAFLELSGLCGTACNPELWQAHRWLYAQSDPQPDSATGAKWDHQHQIGICGDWLHEGRVEGAWLSGRNLAQQVLMSR